MPPISILIRLDLVAACLPLTSARICLPIAPRCLLVCSTAEGNHVIVVSQNVHLKLRLRLFPALPIAAAAAASSPSIL